MSFFQTIGNFEYPVASPRHREPIVPLRAASLNDACDYAVFNSTADCCV
jgi:hypothetical protein